MSAVCVKNLDVGYGKKQILNQISFDLKVSENLSILGANGSGKSTLLRAMLGFIKFNGEIVILGKNIKKYSKKQLAKVVAYIPQTHQPSYEYSVYDIVLMGALCKCSIFSDFSKYDKILALKNLEKMGILHLKDEPYTKISGGERQLAYIARALTQEAKIILMDEPTNGLDFGNQIRLLEMLKSLNSEGLTTIQTTHYPSHAKFVSNRALLIKNGVILDFGDTKKIVNLENINALYDINYENFKDKL